MSVSDDNPQLGEAKLPYAVEAIAHASARSEADAYLFENTSHETDRVCVISFSSSVTVMSFWLRVMQRMELFQQLRMLN